MPKYRVAIRATVEKTYVIDAPDEDDATELAHQIFTVASDGGDENYEQDTQSVDAADENDEVDAIWEKDGE